MQQARVDRVHGKRKGGGVRRDMQFYAAAGKRNRLRQSAGLERKARKKKPPIKEMRERPRVKPAKVIESKGRSVPSPPQKPVGLCEAKRIPIDRMRRRMLNPMQGEGQAV